MKQRVVKSIVSIFLALTIILPVVSVASSAISVPSNMRLISDIETELAPGIISNQAVAYNESGNRIALFVSTVDVHNHDDLHIIANYKDNQCEEYGMQKVSEQVAATEAKHEGEDYRIVNATNATGFNMTTGRPTGVFVMEGVDYTPPGYNVTYPFFAVLKNGDTIIAPMSEYDTTYKGQIQEAVAGFKFLVRDGEVQPDLERYPTLAPRTTIGLTADNKVIIMVADGRQYPYSVGLDNQQQAEIMLSLGCVVAMELDGGGSTTYGCRLPGSDHFEVINKPSDGDERAVSGSLMVVSTAKATGTLDKISIKSDFEYASPHSQITFSASGSDSYGFPVDLPDNVEYALSDPSMGTLDGTVFTAGSKLGEVTMNAYIDGVLYGSKSISIVQPEEIVFNKTVIYAIYGQSVPLPLSAHYNGMDVAINGDDIYTLTGDIEAIAEHPEINGYVEGLTYYAPDENCGIRTTPIYAILNLDEDGTSLIQAKIEFHRESESVFDFSEATKNFGMMAFNRTVQNATLMDSDNDNYQYTVIDPDKQVKVDYVMAIDLGQLQLPDYLQPLWEAFGEGLGGNLWGAFLKISNKIEPQSNITAVIEYNENLSVLDISNLSFNCPLFYIDRENIVIDNDAHRLTLPLMWNDDFVNATLVEHGFIDPVLIDPIGIVTGLEFVVNDGAVESAGTLSLDANVTVSYNLTALSSGAYGTVTKREPIPEEYLEDPTYVPPYVYPELVQYAYINEADGRPGICIWGDYFSYGDSFSLHKAPDEGWSGDSYIYHGQKLRGAYLIDGQICYFDKNGIYDPDYVYYGIVKSVVSDDIYYSLENTLKSGWIYENDEYYYFDKNTYKAVDGVYTVNGQTYTFENKILVDGYWVTAEEGTYLYWAGSRIWRKMFTVKGNTYYFDKDCLMATGITYTFMSGTVQRYCLYDQNGVWMENFTGIYEDTDGKCYYIENGISIYGKTYAGLCKVNDDYYYIRSDFSLVKDQYYTISKTNGYLDKGKYFFDKDGKLVPDDEIKNGIYEEDGALYYYKMHRRTAAGLIMIDNDYYYAQDDGLIATGETAVINTNNLLNQGAYIFDEAGKLTAKSGRNGLFESADGKLYYLNDGDFATGWVSDSGNYYYFDPATYEAVDGEKEIDSLTYTFENKVLVKGSFVTDENGTKYYFAGSPVTDAFADVDSKTYYFDENGYIASGLTKVILPDSSESWYLFDENGAWLNSFTGLYEENGFNYYIENGVSVYGTDSAGLVKIGDDYYYVKPEGTIVKDSYYFVTKTNGLLDRGTYYFDENGALVPNDQIKFGIYNEDGNLYYYENHKRTSAGWVTIDNDKYYAGEGGLLFTSPAIIDGRFYFFNEEGKLVESYNYTGTIPGADGSLYYIENNQLTDGWKLDNGNYYYFDPATHKAVDGEQTIDGHTYEFRDHILYDGEWVTSEAGTSLYWAGAKAWRHLINARGSTYYFNNNSLMETGVAYTFVSSNVQKYYLYDTDGVWMKDYTGLYTLNDFTYYIVDGVSVYGRAGAGLVKIDDDYYYIDTNGQIVKGQFYNVSKTNDLLTAYTYYFDEDGKLDFDTVYKNGIYTDETDGLMYYYVNNAKYYAGLFMIGDDYYYANTEGQVVTGIYKINKTNNLMPADYYMFDETGRMVIGAELKTGIYRDEEDGILYYYYKGLKNYAGLLYIDGDYYYARTNGALAVARYKVSKTNNLMAAGMYDFREDGKMVLGRNGFVEVDGKMRYYVNDDYVKGLVKDDGKYYYFSETDGDMLKGRYIVPAEKSNSLFSETKIFYFDSETGAADAALDFADYSVLAQRYDSFDALDADLYTNYADVKAVFDLVKAWESSNNELDETQQSIVDAKAEELDAALAALHFKPADTTAYNQAMASVPVDLSIYTDASITAMNNAKSAIDALLATADIRNQAELDSLVDAYTAAIAALEEKPADYSRLNYAIARFENVNGNLYANYNDVKAVYDAVKAWKEANANLTVTSQSLVDAKAEELFYAVQGLRYKEADLSELYALINQFRALDPSLYDNYNSAKEIVDAVDNKLHNGTIYITDQELVDTYQLMLEEAIDSLSYKQLDVTAFMQAMETVPEDLTIYTDTSVAAMNDAKNAAVAFIRSNNYITYQSEFDALVDAYVQAIAALEEKAADYSVLSSTLQNFAALDGNLYSNYDAVKAVYDEVKAWADANPSLTITSQNDIDAKSDQLIEAMLTLAYKPIDTSAYEQAQAYVPADLSIYTEESVSAMNNAKSAVDEFLAGDVDIRNQAQLDELVNNYIFRIENLEYIMADYNELLDAIYRIEQMDGSLYKNYDSVKALSDSITDWMIQTPNIPITRQSEIDEKTAILNNAIASLEYKPIDTSAYEQAKASIPSSLVIYTSESRKNVQDARDAIETFLEGSVDIRNQAQLDTLVAALVQAINDLEVFLANYDRLNNAIAEFEAIDGNLYANYNDAKDVYDAVKAWKEANPDKNITQQNEVDDQYQLLKDAIDSLIPVRFGVKEGSTAVIEGNYIYGLKTNLTAANIRNNFLDYEGVEVTLTKAIEEARYYGTGSTITVKYADGTEETYTIIIFGDVDGNAIIDSDDAYATLAAAVDNSLFDAVQRKAANVDGVRRISVDDYAIINDAVLGVNDIDQSAIS